MNFVIKKKKVQEQNSCVKINFSNFMNKNKIHTKFRNKNNNLTKYLYSLNSQQSDILYNRYIYRIHGENMKSTYKGVLRTSIT